MASWALSMFYEEGSLQQPRNREGRIEWLREWAGAAFDDPERYARFFADACAAVIFAAPDPRVIEDLVRDAECDTGALNVARGLVTRYIDACLPMPAGLDGFAQGLIWGKHHKGRKGSKTRHRAQTLVMRDNVIHRAVEEALAMGAPTLADACKEVAEATGRGAMSPNHHKVIRRIWTDREAARGGTRDAHL